MTLPSFPVDEQALNLLSAAISPDPDVADRSSVNDLCAMYSELAGADLSAAEGDEGQVQVARDPHYHPNDIIAALVAEVERLRAERVATLRLVRDLVDADDCWLDHHGGCQAHGYLSLEPGEKCPHQEAKELVEAVDNLTGDEA